jgi:AP-3 complex subunit delta-1
MYMHMLGQDVSWAAFHFVDLMASPRFRGKRIGYLAAAQTFTDATDVMLLTTNLLRKSFASSVHHDASLALNSLSVMATPDLSRDLLQDVTNLLSSSRPLVRKKAVIALYRLLRRLPEALPTAFPRLREKLDDPDPNVVSCTVNVLTELATENPKGYLGLAPALYQVLTASSFHRTPLGMQVLTTAPSRLPTGAHHLVLQLDAH